MSDVRQKARTFVELCSHGRVADDPIVPLYASGLVVARRCGPHSAKDRIFRITRQPAVVGQFDCHVLTRISGSRAASSEPPHWVGSGHSPPHQGRKLPDWSSTAARSAWPRRNNPPTRPRVRVAMTRRRRSRGASDTR